MLGVSGDSSVYSNVESRMTEFVRFVLMRWIRPIESVLEAQLARGTTFRVNVAGLQRADTATLGKYYKDAIETGWMTVDEVRNLEDRPPLGNEGVM